MARVDVPIGSAIATAGTIWTAGTIHLVEGAAIQVDGHTSRLLLMIENSGSAGTVLVLPGTLPHAFRSDLGTLSIAVARLGTAFLVLESARHIQAGGDIYLNFANAASGEAFAGNIYAVRLANP